MVRVPMIAFPNPFGTSFIIAGAGSAVNTSQVRCGMPRLKIDHRIASNGISAKTAREKAITLMAVLNSLLERGRGDESGFTIKEVTPKKSQQKKFQEI
jgi:hypothetical protein